MDHRCELDRLVEAARGGDVGAFTALVRRFQDMALIVLTRTEYGAPPPIRGVWSVEQYRTFQRELHGRVARSVLGGRHVYADGSGPGIQHHRPALVVEAIQTVVREARESMRGIQQEGASA